MNLYKTAEIERQVSYVWLSYCIILYQYYVCEYTQTPAHLIVILISLHIYLNWFSYYFSQFRCQVASIFLIKKIARLTILVFK